MSGREKMIRRAKDIVGIRFGRLIVESLGPINRTSKKTAPAQFWCRCDCGNTRLVDGANLRRGTTRSCGCLRNEESSLRRIQQAVSPETAQALAFLRSYKAGAARRALPFLLSDQEAVFLGLGACAYCGSHPSRNIKVCGRKKTPNRGTLLLNGIDRVDNNTGYSIDNCVSCCTLCNNAKKTLTQKEWLEYLDTLVAFRSKK